MLNKLCTEIHKNAIKHGWWDEERTFGDVIALMHSELSEAIEEYRSGHEATEIYRSCAYQKQCPWDDENGYILHCQDCPGWKPEGVPIELADVIIRILDYCGYKGIDIEKAIKIKHEYNKTRPYKHGGKRI